MAACRIDDPGGGDPAVDAAPGTDGPAGTGFEVNGNDVIVDLTHPTNASLATAGGSRVIQVGTKKVMIGRVSDTEFATTSAICTHAGCTVRFALSASQLQCPCHGSKYMLDGTIVVMAPGQTSQASLKNFTHTFDMATSLLTITLV